MSLKARITGSRDELGTLSEDGLVFFGHRLTRDWREISPTPDVLKKLRGNHHVELQGDEHEPDAEAPRARRSRKAAAEPDAEAPAEDAEG